MKFYYTALSTKGESKEGVLETQDERQLAQLLRKEGLILVRAEPQEKTKKFNLEIPSPFAGISLTDKIFFTRNLQVMIAAGLPLPRALDTLANQTKNQKFKKVILEIRKEVIRGENFSKALEKYPKIFPELFQNMVKAGEESGTLEEVLKVLTHQMERDHELKSKITGAMIYPAIIICAMIGIGILMLVMVVPQLASTFQELEVDLPMTTQVVIKLGDFFTKKWYLVIAILGVLVLFIIWGSRTKIGKKIIDTIALKTPVVSSITRQTSSAYTARTLGSLIKAGVPVVNSLKITAGVLGNSYYKSALLEVAEKVKKGEKIAQALETYENIYPSIVIQMIAVGEETGETSTILSQLADFYEEEVANATQNLASVIEPVIMIIVGAAIGFFAISMMQPMYSMLQYIQ